MLKISLSLKKYEDTLKYVVFIICANYKNLNLLCKYHEMYKTENTTQINSSSSRILSIVKSIRIIIALPLHAFLSLFDIEIERNSTQLIHCNSLKAQIEERKIATPVTTPTMAAPLTHTNII